MHSQQHLADMPFYCWFVKTDPWTEIIIPLKQNNQSLLPKESVLTCFVRLGKIFGIVEILPRGSLTARP